MYAADRIVRSWPSKWTCEVFEQSGREGLIRLIRERSADKAFAGHVYILSDHSSVALAATPGEWPLTAMASSGWTEFRVPECRGKGSARR